MKKSKLFFKAMLFTVVAMLSVSFVSCGGDDSNEPINPTPKTDPTPAEMELTAENIAKWIVDTLPNCYKATVIESENNEATYEI
jgi:6-pyruvoyltetrahydropterin/6-carboxytetrahydropterin synthase